MSHAANLWLYFLVVAGVVAVPGADMAFVLASALVGGRSNGMAAVAGTAAGGMCHIAMGALGIATVLKVWPQAFNAVLLIGAAYLAWIGVSLARHGIAMTSASAVPSALATFRRGALTNLLNPKAYLFMLAVFPQFVRREYGPIWLQALELGAITTATQVAGYGLVTLGASGARTRLARSERAQVAVSRTVGVLLILVAIATAVEGWRLW